jgi:hypothetical protein
MVTDFWHILHWLPDENRWEQITWKSWMAFRADLGDAFVPLNGVSGGIHYFVACALDEKSTLNIIPHKYLIEPNGRIGPDNFNGWTREDRADYRRLMLAREELPGDRDRLREIQEKAGNVFYPPRESLYPLVHALPHPPTPDSAATLLLDAIIAGVTRSELARTR